MKREKKNWFFVASSYCGMEAYFRLSMSDIRACFYGYQLNSDNKSISNTKQKMRKVFMPTAS